MKRLISGISKLSCQMSTRSLLSCMQGTMHIFFEGTFLKMKMKMMIVSQWNFVLMWFCSFFSPMKSTCLIFTIFSIYSSDKNKCYEVIQKLSESYQSDKEYLKVCTFECTHERWMENWKFFFAFSHSGFWCMHACVCGQLAKVWLQLVQLKEEEAVDKKELVQLLQQMTQLLSNCFNEEEQDNETQQHVRISQTWA